MDVLVSAAPDVLLEVLHGGHICFLELFLLLTDLLPALLLLLFLLIFIFSVLLIVILCGVPIDFLVGLSFLFPLSHGELKALDHVRRVHPLQTLDIVHLSSFLCPLFVEESFA